MIERYLGLPPLCLLCEKRMVKVPLSPNMLCRQINYNKKEKKYTEGRRIVEGEWEAGRIWWMNERMKNE
jgi:hypothetical protein